MSESQRADVVFYDEETQQIKVCAVSRVLVQSVIDRAMAFTIPHDAEDYSECLLTDEDARELGGMLMLMQGFVNPELRERLCITTKASIEWNSSVRPDINHKGNINIPRPQRAGIIFYDDEVQQLKVCFSSRKQIQSVIDRAFTATIPPDAAEHHEYLFKDEDARKLGGMLVLMQGHVNPEFRERLRITAKDPVDWAPPAPLDIK
jgi:hypothetical protein